MIHKPMPSKMWWVEPSKDCCNQCNPKEASSGTYHHDESLPSRRSIGNPNQPKQIVNQDSEGFSLDQYLQKHPKNA